MKQIQTKIVSGPLENDKGGIEAAINEANKQGFRVIKFTSRAYGLAGSELCIVVMEREIDV
jgi:hypothetical protein